MLAVDLVPLLCSDNGPFSTGPLASWTLYRSDEMAVPEAVHNQREADTFPSSVVQIGSLYVVSFTGLARFQICSKTQTITAFDVDSGTDHSALEHLLFDHIAPRVLAHEGALVLHGSAVAIDGKVAIFLGETGAGKSTLAASLGEAGHRLLGDDAVRIWRGDEGFLAQAVYHSLRLHHDTIVAVLSGDTQSEPMAHYSDKQRVAVGAGHDNFALPIGAIFLLSGTAVDEPRAHRLGPAQACISALEQSFSLDPNDPQRALERMRQASALVESVEVYQLDYPHDYARLSEVRMLIEEIVG